MSIRKTGDWAAVDKMLSGIGDKFKAEVGKATATNGRILRAAIRGRIENQKFDKPLSAAYLARKLKLGLSENILIATGTLMRNITFTQLDWDKGEVIVLRHEPKKGYDIGWIMEFGSRDGRVPARPFIEPGANDAEPPMVKNYEDAVERVFA